MKRQGGNDFATAWHEKFGESAPSATARMRLVKHCVSELDMSEAAAFALESEICHLHDGARDAYLATMRSLLYNLDTNAALRNVPPRQLAHMSDREMRRGTALEEVERAEAQHQAHFEDMLQQRYSSVDSGHSVMRCRRCKKSNLAFEQKQTRGADESMTIFVSCKDCSLNWKL